MNESGAALWKLLVKKKKMGKKREGVLYSSE
jgi:hypothetical protein